MFKINVPLSLLYLHKVFVSVILTFEVLKVCGKQKESDNNISNNNI